MQATLNAFIDPKPILRDLDIQVNRLPDVTRCPTCLANEFYVGQDPAGGGWYTCGHCRWVGDTPELVAKVRNLPMDRALDYLKRTDRSEVVTQERIAEYLVGLKRRQGSVAFWSEAADRDKLMHTQSEAGQQLLASYRLSELFSRDTWDEGMGQLAGLTTPEMYSRHLDPTNSATRMLGGENKHYVVSPLFDAPGRIAAVATFDIGQGQKRFTSTALPFGTRDALMFMNNVYMHEDTIFATADLAFALCLQIWSYQSLSGSLPLLGYTDETDKAWMNVRPQRVIFWDREVTDDLFLAARKVPDRAYIAMKPRIEDSKDPFSHLKSYTASHFLGCMQGSAVPWLHAMKDYLLSRDYGAARALLTRMDFTPSQRQEMLKYCAKDEERKRMADMIDVGVIEMRLPTTVKGQFIVQRSDGWYLQNMASSSGTPAMTKAIPVIETYTSFALRTVLNGHIRVDGKSIPFEVDKEEFSADWLNRFCDRHGSLVKINSKIEKDLLHYALEFNKPVEAKGLDSIGWDGAGFTFPRFTILPARTEEHRLPIAREHPAKHLLLSSGVMVANARRWFTDTPGHRVYWALMATALANIVAPALKMPTRGIGLVSRHNDDRSMILKGIVEDMALDTYAVKPGKDRETIMAITAAEHEHGIPLHVDFFGSPLALQWMQDSSDRNAITLINPGLSVPAKLRGGWSIIDEKDKVSEIVSIPQGQAIMPMLLSDIAKMGFRLPMRTGQLPDALLTMMHHSFRTRFGFDHIPVLDRAAELIDYGIPDGANGISSRFVGMLLHMINTGVLNLKNTSDLVGPPDEKAAVSVSPVHVYLNLPVIQKAFEKLKLFMPEITTLSQSFFESGLLQEERYGLSAINGWYLELEAWKAECAKWPDI